MCYSAAAIANYFIDKSLETGTPITNMHLQKMLFFAHAAYFKQTGTPLFSDPVIAWQYGPVIESLYHELKCYGDRPILHKISKIDPCQHNGGLSFSIVEPVVRNDDFCIIPFLNLVWDKLSGVDTWRLSALSHQPGGAWYKTLKDKGIDAEKTINFPRNLTILDDVIKECGR